MDNEAKLASSKNDRNVLIAEMKNFKAKLASLQTVNTQLTALVTQLRTGIEQNSENEEGPETNEADDDALYEVERLLNHRKKGRVRQFLVRWVNYGAKDDCWVNEKDLACPGILNEYLQSKNLL